MKRTMKKVMLTEALIWTPALIVLVCMWLFDDAGLISKLATTLMGAALIGTTIFRTYRDQRQQERIAELEEQLKKASRR